MICVRHEWATKYKCIGPASKPNYVLIGDEGSDNYLEGFSIDFNATKAAYEMDFRQNTLLYDLANDLIIDKTGQGVADIRQQALRLSLAVGETFAAWSAATITPGFKELRYIKFLLRAQAKGEPLITDAAETAHVVSSLREALSTNVPALQAFWFRYALEAQLKTVAGVAGLRSWVHAHGGAYADSGARWWEDAWMPLVRTSGAPIVGGAEPAATPEVIRPARRNAALEGVVWGWWRWLSGGRRIRQMGNAKPAPARV